MPWLGCVRERVICIQEERKGPYILLGWAWAGFAVAVVDDDVGGVGVKVMLVEQGEASVQPLDVVELTSGVCRVVPAELREVDHDAGRGSQVDRRGVI